MNTLQIVLQYILHIDTYLIAFVSEYGAWAYVALFAIIFCETGLVLTPILPGDSLLFAAGSIAANTSKHGFNVHILFISLSIACILGNKTNYLIGKFLGPKVFHQSSHFFNRNHLLKAHAFYEKHGGRTLILARFIPIVRTFAPFVAGVSYMQLSRFTFFNIISGLLWVGSLLGAGYFFGSLPIVQENFSIAIYAIVGLSLLPPLVAFLIRKTKKFA